MEHLVKKTTPKPTTKDKKIDRLLEQAASKIDLQTRAGREAGARIITRANAIKRGQPTPKYARSK